MFKVNLALMIYFIFGVVTVTGSVTIAAVIAGALYSIPAMLIVRVAGRMGVIKDVK